MEEIKMKKQILILMGMFFVTGVMNAARTQEELNKDLLGAVRNKELGVVRNLLSMGADPNMTVVKGEEWCVLKEFVPLLNIALGIENHCLNGSSDHEIVRALIEDARTLVDKRTISSVEGIRGGTYFTPLCYAIKHFLGNHPGFDLDLIVTFIKKGASTDLNEGNDVEETEQSIRTCFIEVINNANQKIIEEKNRARARANVLMQVAHPRLGAGSAARVLPKEVLREIFELSL